MTNEEIVQIILETTNLALQLLIEEAVVRRCGVRELHWKLWDHYGLAKELSRQISTSYLESL
jgi:hypothetical protein